ncbi:MAG: phosphatidate cytidylyltransferase [Gammaproteobacteria bacterium]|nr:phosphatidate cytidylyltransferase [Gammaproteobacteria bacterium]
MLKQRVITAAMLLPIVVLLVLMAPTWLFAIVSSLMVIVGMWEWSKLSGGDSIPGNLFKALLVSVILYLLWLIHGNVAVLWVTEIAAMAWWIFASFWVFFWHKQFPKSIKYICGLLTLIPAWMAFVDVHAGTQGPKILLFLLALIWSADIGAYFSGKVFGRHKLAPKVSPGKTWEGVAGGSLAMLGVSITGVILVLPQYGYFFVIICLFSGWFSVVGDLSESLFKRQAGVKDSGRLFPGHGGLLDRVDSLTAALPTFWLGLAMQGWLR